MRLPAFSFVVLEVAPGLVLPMMACVTWITGMRCVHFVKVLMFAFKSCVCTDYSNQTQ
jgi:hypothetical protein